MKYTLILILGLSVQNTYAQSIVDVTNSNYNAHSFQVVGGNPITNIKYVSLVEGSPYFQDDWVNAKLITNEGAVFQDIPVKLNLIENAIHYKDQKGNEMVVTMSIREVILPDRASTKSLRFINGNILPTSKKGWYLLLHNANVSFFKFFEKTLSENRPYNSATTEQTIRTNVKYFVMMNNVSHPVKTIKDLHTVFKNKQKDMEMFIKTQDSKKPMEERMIEMVAHYNTLVN